MSQVVPISDIVALTGYVRHADQVKWLERHCWVHEVNRKGMPVVSVSYFEQKMGGIAIQRINEPDFSKMPKRA